MKMNIQGATLLRRRITYACCSLAVCLLTFSTFTTLATESCPRTTIKFSEVCYYPTNGQSQWVELFNTGTESVDVRGMEIVSGTNSYSLPLSLTEEMPTNGYLLIYFDGGGSNDISFAGDNLAVLHSPTTNFLGNPDGSLSLYQVTGIQTPATIVDFVAWGDSPGTNALDAVNRGVWNATNVFLWTDPTNQPIGPGSEVLSQGQALVRTATLEWEIDTATIQSSVVALAKLPTTGLSVPQLVFPSDGLHLLSSPTRLRLTAVKGASIYEIQVSTNQDFTNVFRSFTTGDPIMGAVVNPPLLNNAIYWWRARANNGNGLNSDWSAPQRFIIGFPSTSLASPSRNTVTPLTSGYSVSGQVTDKTPPPGTPIPPTPVGLPGATVTINGQTATSDANGNFTISGLAPGTYAVNVVMAHYTFPSPPQNVTITDSDKSGITVSGTGAFNSLADFKSLAARKDTAMLAVTPGNSSQIMCDRDNGNNQEWDAPHHPDNPSFRSISNTDLESWWCWAVGATMLNHYYHGSITEDEVVYHIKGGLLHDKDAGASWHQLFGINWGDCPNAIKYALNTDDAHIDYGSKPSNDQIQQWIDSGRPIYQSVTWKEYKTVLGFKIKVAVGAHITVISGYDYYAGRFYTLHNNSDNDGTRMWIPMDEDNLNSWCDQVAVPKIGVVGINTDTSVTQVDPNGLCEFDNVERFHCSTTATDTDDDGIPDKTEIASWAFPRDGVGGNVAGKEFATVKNNRKAAEAAQYTADTDGGGVKDGDEDANHNGLSGKWDSPETDVFDPSDDKAGLDLCFCIDTTGSMGPYIAGVQANMISLINYVAANFPKYRIAIVGYKDFPDQDSSYLTYVYSPFTNDTTALINKVNSMTVNGGGDTPEAVYSGLIECMTDPALGGWRPDPVKRAIIAMGDAPSHDPEEDGTTLATVEAIAGSGGPTLIPVYLGSAPKSLATPMDASSTIDTNTLSGSISTFPIWVGYDPTAGASWTNIAAGTGGSVVQAPTGSDVSSAVEDQINTIKASTTASLTITGPSGETNVRGLTNILADASHSFDPNGCGILKYEWDWNYDGVYDEMTLAPVVTHTYPSGLNNSIGVLVTTVGGDTATASFILPALPATSVEILSQVMSTNIDRQTGLYYEQVVITNTSSGTIDGLEISATNLPPGVWFVTATGTNAGVPYVDFANTLAPGETVTLNLAFYSSDRQAPVGIGISVGAITVTPPTPATGDVVAINRSYMRPDGNMAVEFKSASGRVYVVEYSSDMVTWKQARPPITGNGTTMIWVDSGPPETDSPPASGARFYRLLMLPQ